jgi:hypothetical protein
MARFTSRLEGWLASPRVFWVALGAAILVALPGLEVHPVADEFLASGVLERIPAPVPPPATEWSLYRYTMADLPAMQLGIVKGIYPWWTSPELKLAFFRPLSSALLTRDHALFAGHPLGGHLDGMLWYLALVAIVAALLRRVLPGPLGAIALVIYAVSDKHGEVLSSMTGRHLVVAGACGFLGLLCHVRGREHGGRRWLPLSLLALGLGLAGGEAAISVFLYLAMYELLAAPGTARVRLMALAPAALLLAAWWAAYTALGYGCEGSDFFVSPVSEPLLWLRGLPLAVPVLLGALLLHVPADLAWGSNAPWLAALGVAGVVLVSLLLRASWASLTGDERRHVRWLVAGALLAVPSVAVLPATNRVLLVPNLGAAVAVAVPLVALVRAVPSLRRSWRVRAMGLGGGALAVIHLAVSPLLLYASISLVDRFGVRAEEVQQVLVKELDPVQLPRQRLVVLAVPNMLYGLYTSTQWWAAGRVLPKAWLTLSLSPEVHRVTRTGPATLEMELVEGRFFADVTERVHRSGRSPLPVGAKVRLDGLTAEVAEADAQGVRRLRFVFDVPLEDPSLVILSFRDRALRRWTPPPVGGSVEINRVVPTG